MKLTWTAADKASTYAISYGLKPGEYIYGILDTGNVLEYTINELDPNQKYYFAVRAIHGCRPGDLSNELPAGGIGGAVLGASTLAATGVADEMLAMYSIVAGAGSMLASLYGIYKTKKKS